MTSTILLFEIQDTFSKIDVQVNSLLLGAFSLANADKFRHRFTSAQCHFHSGSLGPVLVRLLSMRTVLPHQQISTRIHFNGCQHDCTGSSPREPNRDWKPCLCDLSANSKVHSNIVCSLSKVPQHFPTPNSVASGLSYVVYMKRPSPRLRPVLFAPSRVLHLKSKHMAAILFYDWEPIAKKCVSKRSGISPHIPPSYLC